jgi:hypothetical protein
MATHLQALRRMTRRKTTRTMESYTTNARKLSATAHDTVKHRAVGSFDRCSTHIASPLTHKNLLVCELSDDYVHHLHTTILENGA